MTSFRGALVALVATTTLALGGCGASSPSTATTPTPAASSTSQAMPSGGPPSGGPTSGGGAGPTGKAMTTEATAKMAEDLGVSPDQLTAAITKARAGGAGVNLVKTLLSELNLPEATVAAELKTIGSDGP